jgi:hypothetical protein
MGGSAHGKLFFGTGLKSAANLRNILDLLLNCIPESLLIHRFAKFKNYPFQYL